MTLKFKKIQNIDRHGPGPKIYICHLSYPLDFHHRLPLKIADFFPAWITITPKPTIFLWRKKMFRIGEKHRKIWRKPVLSYVHWAHGGVDD
jgi:hypothetical protein